MIKNILKQLHRGEKGITGLETAIILIAFVVVAAVFAYTVLSAGLFSTQKSQEAVYSGLEQVQSTTEIKGNVVAKAETTGASGYLSQLTFTVANAIGGEPVDFTTPDASSSNTGLVASGSNNKIVISYTDADQRVEDLYWTKVELSGDGDDLLEANEKFQITIGNATAAAAGGNLVDALNPNLVVNKAFNIQLKGTKGAVITFERTTPAFIDAVMILN